MSAENPSVPLSQADEDFLDIFAGPPTSSGIRVNRNRALGYSAIWRGVNLIAGDVGRLPFGVYHKAGAVKTPDPKHQAARVMRRPNDYMTPFTFRQTLQAHALLDGNGYAYIVRDLEGRPVELLPLDPGRTWPVRANGELLYVSEVRDPLPGKRRKNKLVKIPAPDMLHIKGLGFDGLCGYSVIQILRDAIGAAIAAREFGSRYFRNNARPGVALEVPAGMKDVAVNNLRDSWERLQTGIDNAHRVAILRDGVKLSMIEMNARDAQLLENREFDAREIANVIGVPPHKLGDPSRTAYNSLESENQSYQDDTLDRWLISWEQECDSKLLTEGEKEFETHCCEFTRIALSRTNLQARGAYYSQALTAGWLNRDEVRAYENLNPIPGGQGAVFTLPVNVAADKSGDGTPDPSGDPKPADPPKDDAADGTQQKSAPTADVQAQALNGAQVASLMLLCDKLVAGQYPRDGVEAILRVAFPAMDKDAVDGILRALDGLKPSSAAKIGDPGEQSVSLPEPDDGDRSALRAAIRQMAADTVGRMVRRLATHAERLAKRPAELRAWLGQPMHDEHAATIIDALRPVIAARHAIGAGGCGPDEFAANLLADFRERVRSRIGVTSDLAVAIREAVATIETNTFAGEA